MELTFKDYRTAYRMALKLVNFGRVRIERCYRFRDGLEVVYKLYLDCLCVGEEILNVLQEFSNLYEEDFEDVKRVLIEKDRILRMIMDSLSEGEKTLDELKFELNLDERTLRALIDELEENGYVVEDEKIRLSKPL